MEEAEEEERELEDTEDLLEYYLQRAAATQSEAERLLDGARDLEESIGVSLSARRFEVSFACPYLVLFYMASLLLWTVLACTRNPRSPAKWLPA